MVTLHPSSKKSRTLEHPPPRTAAPAVVPCSFSIAAVPFSLPPTQHMATAAAASQQLRHVGSRGGGDRGGDDRAYGGTATSAINKTTMGSTSDFTPAGGRATAPHGLGSEETSNPAIPTATAQPSLGVEGGQRSAHDFAADTRPPLFFSSTVASGSASTSTQPSAAAMRAPMPTATATGAVPVVAAGSSQVASLVRKSEGDIPFDSAASSSASSFAASRGGGGSVERIGGVGGSSGRGDGSSLHGQNRRVFSSLPADDHSAGGADGVRHPSSPTTPQTRQQQKSPPLSPRISVEDEELLATYSAQDATPLSLRDIHAFCQSTTASSRMMQARFLHREVRRLGAR